MEIEAKEAAVREVAKLLSLPELLPSIASIKSDYLARQQANDAQLSTLVAEQIEQARKGIDALSLSRKTTNQLRDNFLSIEKLCQECQTLIENHDKIKLLSNARNNLNTTLKVKGSVFMTDTNGAYVDITAKSSAYLPVQEACIHKIKHVSEAGIYPGLVEEFVVIGENNADDSLILSLRSIQYDLVWERCRQLQAEDVVVKGKVVGGNKGGVVAIVEGLRGFVPFSQISTVSLFAYIYN